MFADSMFRALTCPVLPALFRPQWQQQRKFAQMCATITDATHRLATSPQQTPNSASTVSPDAPAETAQPEAGGSATITKANKPSADVSENVAPSSAIESVESLCISTQNRIEKIAAKMRFLEQKLLDRHTAYWEETKTQLQQPRS